MGVGTGSFLAVDWALMTDIIPKASSGRYMGISNVATATNGVVSAFIGGVLIDALVRAGSPALGPRVAFLLAPVWFAIGALLLRPVVEGGARTTSRSSCKPSRRDLTSRLSRGRQRGARSVDGTVGAASGWTTARRDRHASQRVRGSQPALRARRAGTATGRRPRA